MTREEVEARKEALEIMMIAQEGYATEARIAERLMAWTKAEAERGARTCLYVAKEWRTNPLPGDWDAECKKLREQGASSADLCAYRIAPWLRSTSARPSDE